MTTTEFCDQNEIPIKDRVWIIANCRTMREAWDTARPILVVWIALSPGVLDVTTRLRFYEFANKLRIRHAANRDAANRHAQLESERAAQAAWLRANATPNWEASR
jgi:hypothetical protein